MDYHLYNEYCEDKMYGRVHVNVSYETWLESFPYKDEIFLLYESVNTHIKPLNPEPNLGLSPARQIGVIPKPNNYD